MATVMQGMMKASERIDERDDVNESDSGHQPQMADDETSDSQALTGGDITRYRALVARISNLSQDRLDLKIASMQVCCAMAKPALRDMERVKRIGRYLAGKPEPDAGSAGSRVASWTCTQALTGRVTRLPGVIMRGGHCLKTWTHEQQVVSLSSAESELYAAVKAASEGLGVQSLAKDLGVTCGLNLHLDAPATMCLVSRRGLGKAKHVDMQNLWIQVRHEEV